MKNKTKTIPASPWPFATRIPPTILEARQGKPKGKVVRLFQLEGNWAEMPNTLFEDSAGQLWLAFTEERFPPPESIAVDERGFLAVSIEEALEWMENALQFVDGYDGDPADICRLALREIRSRPTYTGMVERALIEEIKFKRKFSRKAKR